MAFDFGAFSGSLARAGARAGVDRIQGQRDRRRDDRMLEAEALSHALQLAQLSEHGVHQGTAPATAPLDINLTGLPGGTAQHVDLPGKNRYEQLTPQFYQDQAPRREAQMRASEEAATERQLKVAQAQRARAEADRALREPAGPQTPWVKAGFPDTDQGRRDFLKFRRQEALATDTSPSVPHEDPAAAEEAQGVALLGTNLPEPQRAAYSKAFRAIRTQHPTWPAGRVAMLAKRSVDGARPDLRPQPPKREDEIDRQIAAARAEAGGGGQGKTSADLQRSGDTPDASSVEAANAHAMSPEERQSAAADEYDALTQAGIAPAEAERRLRAKYGL